MKGIYLLVNLKTGLMDGFYDDFELATDVAKFFKSVGQRGWVVTEILNQSRRRLSLPDNLFHCTAGSVANEKNISSHYEKLWLQLNNKRQA